jgi:hypothetical protein
LLKNPICFAALDRFQVRLCSSTFARLASGPF